MKTHRDINHRSLHERLNGLDSCSVAIPCCHTCTACRGSSHHFSQQGTTLIVLRTGVHYRVFPCCAHATQYEFAAAVRLRVASHAQHAGASATTSHSTGTVLNRRDHQHPEPSTSSTPSLSGRNRTKGLCCLNILLELLFGGALAL